MGQREAVLIDAQFMASDVAALGDMIEDSGKELTAIYITHGHADHHFGLGPLLERFPRARALATPGVIDYITANSENETGLWKIMFGDRFVRPTVVPEPLDGHKIELEDAELRIIEVGQGDIRPSTVVHIPAIGTVVPGDVVYNRIHVMLALSTPDEWRQWLAKADNDLLNIQNNLASREIPWDTVCFHAQQCGEKALKADPANIEAMLAVTRAYSLDGKNASLEKAIQYAQKAIEQLGKMKAQPAQQGKTDEQWKQYIDSNDQLAKTYLSYAQSLKR